MRIFKGFFPIIFFLLILFFSFSRPPFSYADTPIIEYLPSPVYINSGLLTFTFSLPNTSINTFEGSNWSFQISRTKSDTIRKNIWQYSTNFLEGGGIGRDDARKLTVAIKLGGDLVADNYTYTFWSGNISESDRQRALKDGSAVYENFAINPPSGKDVNGNDIGLSGWITYNLIQAGQETDFIAANINPDTIYTVFFDGEKSTEYIGRLGDYVGRSGNKAKIQSDYQYQGATYTVAILPITIDKPGTNKIICLKMGQPFGLIGLDCNYPSLPFNVVSYLMTGFTPTPQASDTIGIPDPNAPIPDNTLPDVPLPCAKDKLINGKCTAVDTALGEISTDPAIFVKYIFGVVLGLAGGIALILIIISGYKYMASQGNPEAVKAATEGLTSAIVGLLFIIFSFVILQIVGVDILRIPGFGQ